MLGDNIKEAMRKIGIKSAELGRRTGIPSGYMSEIVNDKKMPTVEKLQAIAKALNTTTSALLGEDCIYAGVDCEQMEDAIKKQLLEKIMRALQE